MRRPLLGWVCVAVLAASAAAAGQGSAPTKGGGQTKPAAGNSSATKSSGGKATPATEAPKRPTQVFIVGMKGHVGSGLRHDEMVAVEKEADKIGPNQVIVLKIDSGGGSVTEGDKIGRTLERIREKHRLVAWIVYAISGAAFTAMHCPEIYFMDVGTMGSITKFSSDGSGGQVSASGEDLKAWIERVAEVAEGGGRNGQVGRAMVYSPLVVSYTKDPKTGKVTFFADDSGEFMLSDEKDNLTFTSSTAMDCGYINGVANTEEELFAAMQLVPGSFEVNPAGQRIGEKWYQDLEKAMEQCRKIQEGLGSLNEDPSLDAAGRISRKIKLYEQMKEIWRRATPAAMGIGPQGPGGGMMLPPESEIMAYAPDLAQKFDPTGPDGVKKAIEVIDRCIKGLQQELAAARKKKG